MWLLLATVFCAMMLAAPGSLDAQAAVGSAVGDAPRPGDQIRLRVWREPDLSGEFPVDEAGEVVLPKLGPMRVSNLTAQQLKERLVEAYGRFLQHSSVDVTLLRRVQVLGAVRNPGLIMVDPTMTISDALALAGGATAEGNPRRLELMREGRRIAARLSPEERIARAQIRSGDQIFVPERSWLSRNTGLVAAGVSAGASIFIALFLR